MSKWLYLGAVHILRDHLHAQTALYRIYILKDHLHVQMAPYTVHILIKVASNFRPPNFIDLFTEYIIFLSGISILILSI